MRLFSNIRSIVLDAIAFARNLCRSRSALAAENLFLRKQLTFFVERKQAPRRTNNATRVTMATLARIFDWKEALIVVKPDTLVLWHRKGFRLFWRWKSRPKGRPTLPEELKKVNNHRLEGGGFKGCQLEIDCRREEARHPGSLCTPLPSRPLCFLNSPPDILGPRSAGPKTSSSGEQTPEGVLGSLFLLATARSYSRSWCGR